MKLIDADALYDRCSIISKNHDFLYFDNKDEDIILDVIDSMPTIDAELVRHAYWKEDGSCDVDGNKYIRCSCCDSLEVACSKYCRYCGAKMEDIDTFSENSPKNKIQCSEEDRAIKDTVENCDKIVEKFEIKNGEFIKIEESIRKDIEYELKHERLVDIFKDFFIEVWRVRNVRKLKPKCTKCDEDRMISFKSPSGRLYYEECNCKKSIDFYEPEKLECYEFHLNKNYPEVNKLRGYYRTCDGERYYTTGIEQGQIYSGQKYEEVYCNTIYFKTKEEAQRYADWLNENKTIMDGFTK